MPQCPLPCTLTRTHTCTFSPPLSLSLQGLEDQLLALVVNKERPDLEATKTQLIIQNSEFTIKLKALEEALLSKLSNAQGVWG